MLNARPSVEIGILENIILGIPRVAKAMEDLPVEQLWSVLGAVEGSYWRALARRSLLSGLVSLLAAMRQSPVNKGLKSAPSLSNIRA